MTGLTFAGVEDALISQAAHTRVPNVVADWIEPLLSSSERDCLRYIIRRTIGYADPTSPGKRKARDTIAIDQFVSGATSGNYLLDLGTVLSRNAVKKALKGLEDKELVEVELSCATCMWERQPGEPGPTVTAESAAPQCPRCRRTLSRSYKLADITPRKVRDLLNRYDRKKRIWHWDAKRRMPYWEEAPEKAEARKRSEQDLREEAIRLYKLLWFKDLVEQCVKLAEAQLKAGRKVTMTRRINNFYRPVWELQEKYNNPALLKYALEQTVAGPALRRPDTHGWVKYLAKVCDNNAAGFAGKTVVEGTNADAAQRNSIESRERAVRELLRRAYQLNRGGDQESARVLLSDILAQTKSLAELFGGDEKRCDAALRLAYKQGESDFVAARPNQYAAVDYYPEWSWPDDLPA